jgi:hypothetical protein
VSEVKKARESGLFSTWEWGIGNRKAKALKALPSEGKDFAQNRRF